jgi:hypothetical protein
MKYTFLISIAVISVLIACSANKETELVDSKTEKRTFKKDSLQGKYQLIMSLNKDSLTDENKEFNQGLFSLVMLGSNIELEFLESRKGLMTVEGGMMEIAAAFLGGKIQKFNYSFIDSTLILDLAGSSSKDTLGQIVKYTDNYDYLDIVSPELVQYSLKRVD